MLEDLFPASLEPALKNNQVSSYPFVVTGLPHLAYNSETVTDTIPIRRKRSPRCRIEWFYPPMVRPAGCSAWNFTGLGGTLINEAGQTMLQVEPLATALQQLFTAKSNGFIL